MKRKYLEKTESVPERAVGSGKAITAQILAVEEDEVLEIDVFENCTLLARHFVSKGTKDFDTLFMAPSEFVQKYYHAGEWGKVTLRNVFAKGQIYWWDYGEEISCDKLSAEIIGKYCLDTFNIRPYQKVREMEDVISAQKSNDRYFRKVDRINELMSAVIPVTGTEEFKVWIAKVFPTDYLFPEKNRTKRGYKCHCTACEKNYFSKDKPKHNEIVMCKQCKKEVRVKTRVQQVVEKQSVLVAQPYKADTWILRHFRFQSIAYMGGKQAKRYIEHCERVRMFISPNNTKIYYGTDRDSGAAEYIQDWWTTKGGMVIDHNFLMYPGRLTETNMSMELKRLLVEGSSNMVSLDYNMLIRSYRRHPYMEYLLKGRYYKLAKEILKVYGWWGHPEEYLDIHAENVADLLQIDKQRAYRLRDMNGGMRALEWLQIEERDGIKVSQENLMFAEEYEVNISDLEIGRTKMSINRAINYIRRQMELNNMSYKTIRQYYKDYLDMAEERGMDLTDDIVRANSKMIEYHMKYLEEKNAKADKKAAQRLARKFPNIKKDFGRNQKMFAWENGEYVVIVPRNVMDIVQEGRKQHHCVAASDNYFQRMNDHVSYILMLRKKNFKEIPYYTLEVSVTEKNVKVIQKYAAYDRQPDIQIVNKVLTEWQKEVSKRLKKQNAVKAAV